MRFSKMHALGNDYVVVENWQSPQGEEIKRLCDRHLGVGADGVLVVHPSKEADFRMKIYNADGSAAKMCGNGIRCFAKYIYEKRLMRKNELFIETDSGIRQVELFVHEKKVVKARVNMGRPICKEDGFVSLGNDHIVMYTKNLDLFPLEKIGPCFSRESVNVEVVQIVDKNTICMRVWERGVGETMACGTGACAAVVASCLERSVHPNVTVKMKNGCLEVEWDRKEDVVYLTGEAVHVFDGEIHV